MFTLCRVMIKSNDDHLWASPSHSTIAPESKDVLDVSALRPAVRVGQ